MGASNKTGENLQIPAVALDLYLDIDHKQDWRQSANYAASCASLHQ